MTVTREAPVGRLAWTSVIGAVLRRPGLWWTALRQVWSFVPRDWWRRRPFLPMPDRAYLAFRIETHYGTSGTPEAEQVVAYLTWCREMRAIARDAR